MIQLLVVPIESIYSSDTLNGKERLNELLDAVDDATGKEDLVLHLRMLALQKVALENGYNRLIVGSCTSRIACHVIAETVKGKGYSLQADVQYVDARWKIPVLLPLRDCTAQELNLLCQLDGLKILSTLGTLRSGINALVSSFMSLMQEENPSRGCMIVQTAQKLAPFHFNRIPETNDNNVPLAIRRRQRRNNFKLEEFISSDSFCPICNGPLHDSDMLGSRNPEDGQSWRFIDACCSSCQFQILPTDTSSMEHFYRLLPPQLVAQAEHNIDHSSFLR